MGVQFHIKTIFNERYTGFSVKIFLLESLDSFNQRLRVPEGTVGVLRLALF